jgi:hypothetical protein
MPSRLPTSPQVAPESRQARIAISSSLAVSPQDDRAGYSRRHRARPNMPPYVWFPYRFTYTREDGAWSMALA